MLAVMTEVQEGKHHLNSLKINLKTRIHYSFFPALMKLAQDKHVNFYMCDVCLRDVRSFFQYA